VGRRVDARTGSRAQYGTRTGVPLRLKVPDSALTDHLERRTLSGESLVRRSKRFDLRKEPGAAWLQDLLKPQVTLLALGLLRYHAFFGKLFAEPSSEAIQAR
jgi:hypothetical protein